MYYPTYQSSKFVNDLDVVVINVPLEDYEEAIQDFSVNDLKGKLIVDNSVMNDYPKSLLLEKFGEHPEIDILVTHPMLRMSCSDKSWSGRPVVYEKVRVTDTTRCDRFLKVYSDEGCKMVEMSSDEHDSSVGDAEFVTHLTGRLLSEGNQSLLPASPVRSREYAALTEVAECIDGTPFDRFYSFYKYNARAAKYLSTMRDNLASLERQLAAREAYLQASNEMRDKQRLQLLRETRELMIQAAATNEKRPESRPEKPLPTKDSEPTTDK